MGPGEPACTGSHQSRQSEGVGWDVGPGCPGCCPVCHLLGQRREDEAPGKGVGGGAQEKERREGAPLPAGGGGHGEVAQASWLTTPLTLRRIQCALLPHKAPQNSMPETHNYILTSLPPWAGLLGGPGLGWLQLPSWSLGVQRHWTVTVTLRPGFRAGVASPASFDLSKPDPGQPGVKVGRSPC